MAEYELVRNMLRLAPFVIILILIVLLWKQSRLKRFTIVILLGWILTVLFTEYFWDYSFDNAPTKAIQMDVGMRDGGPRVGSVIFGWIYPLFLLCLSELFRAIYTKASRHKGQQEAS